MDSHLRAFEALSGVTRLSDLVTLTRSVVEAMAASRRADWPAVGVRTRAEEMGVVADEVTTPFGDALAVLDRGPEDAAERALCAALAAHFVAEQPPKGRDEEDALAAMLVWLSAFTPFDALPLVDRALGDDAEGLWSAVAARVRAIATDEAPSGSRGEALVAATALTLSPSAKAKKLAASLANDLDDPALAHVLGRAAAGAEGAVHLEGEITPAPKSFLATAALAVTGLLFVMYVVRLVARVALSYRRPAAVTLSGDGVRIESKTILLGRTLRERSVVIDRGALVRAGREVRYPRAAFYAGLLSLAVGSYVGVATLVDGARAASPSLLATGLLLVALGIALDFVLGSIAPTARGRCRVLFVPQRGPSFCVGWVDAASADAALTHFANAR